MKPSTKNLLARSAVGWGGAILCAKLLEPATEHAAPIALALVVASAVGAFVGGRRDIFDRVQFTKFEVPDELIEKMATCGACRRWSRTATNGFGDVPFDPEQKIGTCGKHGPMVRFPSDWSAANCEHYRPRDE